VLGDVPGVDPAALCVGADATIGMSSMLLHEAALLGMPVVSHQPGLRLADHLGANHLGWTSRVDAPADLAKVLAVLLDEPGTMDEADRRSRTRLGAPAAEAVIQQIRKENGR
jgi:predicted glycosyltransferase